MKYLLAFLLLWVTAFANANNVWPERFIDNKDGTITDTTTGLMWQRCQFPNNFVNGTCEFLRNFNYSLEEAQQALAESRYAGYDDWRVPEIDELKSLAYCSSGDPEYWPKGERWDCVGVTNKRVYSTILFPGRPMGSFSDALLSQSLGSLTCGVTPGASCVNPAAFWTAQFDHYPGVKLTSRFVTQSASKKSYLLAVRKAFDLDEYPVTAVIASGAEFASISPQEQLVTAGDTAVFSINLTPGYYIEDIQGCDGKLEGSFYKTATINDRCRVTLRVGTGNFKLNNNHTLGGEVLPLLPFNDNVKLGDEVKFRVIPAKGHHLLSIEGCGGTLQGDIYTTAPIYGACEVNTVFGTTFTSAIDNDWFEWRKSELQPWVATRGNKSIYDQFSLKSAAGSDYVYTKLVNHGDEAWIEADITGAGKLSFSAGAEGIAVGDLSIILVNGVEVFRHRQSRPLDYGFTQQILSRTLTFDGPATVRWVYKKESSGAPLYIYFDAAVWTPADPDTGYGPRYIATEPGTFIDNDTGLMWMRCYFGETFQNGKCEGTLGARTFAQFAESVADVDVAGYTDWRIPTLSEIKTIGGCYDSFPGERFNSLCRTLHPIFRGNYYTVTTPVYQEINGQRKLMHLTGTSVTEASANWSSYFFLVRSVEDKARFQVTVRQNNFLEVVKEASAEGVSAGLTVQFQFTAKPEVLISKITGCGLDNTFPMGKQSVVINTPQIWSDCEVVVETLLDRYLLVSTNAGTLSAIGGNIDVRKAAVKYGDQIKIKVRPEPGYALAEWHANGTFEEFIFTSEPITSNSHFIFKFTNNHYEVSTRPTEGGTLVPGRGRFLHGETPIFNVVTEPGYGLRAIQGCGGTLQGRQYLLSPLRANCEIVASFRKIALQQAVDFDGGELTSSGDHQWFGQNELFEFGGDALHITDVPVDQESRLTLKLNGAGRFTFFAWHDGYTPASSLQVWLNGTRQSVNFTEDKQRHTLMLPEGDNVVEWVFVPGAYGERAKYWLDYFSWTRAGTAGENERYFDNSDGTLTDLQTGLVWRRCSLGQVWRNGTCEGLPTAGTFEDATVNAFTPFAGYDDWRLPNAKELGSLVYCVYGYPAFWPNSHNGCVFPYKQLSIDENAFPNTGIGDGYWTIDRIGENRRAVFFERGNASSVWRNGYNYARYVRGSPKTFNLSYRRYLGASGTGKIKITTVSDGRQLECTISCLEYFVGGSEITLEAIPDENNTFGGWTGDCTGTDVCRLTLYQSFGVEAVFNATTGYPDYYIDNGDGTVTDTQNGLMWMRCPLAQQFRNGTCYSVNDDRNHKTVWSEAANRAGVSVFAGYTDWQLPTENELKTLLTCLKPEPLPGGGFWLPNRCTGDFVGRTINHVAFPNSGAIEGVWSRTKAVNDMRIVHFLFREAKASHVLERHDTYLVRQIPSNSYVLGLRFAGGGQGQIINSFPFISCDEDCDLNLSVGSVNNLLAKPAIGSVFSGWEGECSGIGEQCQVFLNQSKQVTARFDKAEVPVNVMVNTMGGSVTSEQSVSYYGTSMRFTLLPNKGYGVSANVTGTCPIGKWVDEFTYETGPVFAPCTVNFYFVRAKRKGIPLWLLVQPQGDL